MAENPATWGPVELVIFDAMREVETSQRAGFVGLSTVRVIADKLREAGLVDEAAVATAARETPAPAAPKPRPAPPRF